MVSEKREQKNPTPKPGAGVGEVEGVADPPW